MEPIGDVWASHSGKRHLGICKQPVKERRAIVQPVWHTVREDDRTNVDMAIVGEIGLQPGPWLRTIKDSTVGQNSTNCNLSTIQAATAPSTRTGVAGRADFEINVVRRSPVNGGVNCGRSHQPGSMRKLPNVLRPKDRRTFRLFAICTRVKRRRRFCTEIAYSGQPRLGRLTCSLGSSQITTEFRYSAPHGWRSRAE